MIPFELFCKVRAWWTGETVEEIMREQTLIRFHQYGGAQMTDAAWERFCNEMSRVEFANMILNAPTEIRYEP